MLDRRYLELGLNALARAAEKSYFADGHRGGAIVSAFFFCREERLEPGVPEAIGELINAHYAGTDLCAPFPAQPTAADATDRIVAAMRRRLDGLRQAGHNVILPTLALRALREMPEAGTPARLDGIVRLVDSFTQRDALELRPGDERPPGEARALAEMVLGEFIATGEHFDGRGQGWTGHLLTYARALVDLRELGLGDLADEAAAGFAVYLKRIRLGPLETDQPRAEHAQTETRPDQLAYWRAQADRDPGLGHVFKYPYGFYGLARRAGDAAERARPHTWRVF